MAKNLHVCSVPQCSQRYTAGVAFHGFPSDVNLKKLWIDKLQIGKKVTVNMKVCSRHFQKSDYYFPDVPAKKHYLKKGAVPSNNLPRRSHDRPGPSTKIEKAEERYYVILQKIGEAAMSKPTTVTTGTTTDNQVAMDQPRDGIPWTELAATTTTTTTVDASSFPFKNVDRLNKWTAAVRRKNCYPKKNSMLCSDHFHPSAYVLRPGAARLLSREDAVPTIFISPECESPQETAATPLKVSEAQTHKYEHSKVPQKETDMVKRSEMQSQIDDRLNALPEESAINMVIEPDIPLLTDDDLDGPEEGSSACENFISGIRRGKLACAFFPVKNQHRGSYQRRHLE